VTLLATATVGRSARPPRSRRRAGFWNVLFVLPFLLFVGIFRIWPDIYGFYISFHDWEILLPNKPFIGLANYAELAEDQLFWTTLRNTTLFAALTVAGNTVVGLGAALLVCQPIRGQQLFRVVFYAPVVLSVAVMAIVMRRAFNTEYGLANFYLNWLGFSSVTWLDASWGIPTLSAATIWWTFGFPMLIFLAGLLNIPQPLYEAARIDGATGVQAFFRITLPLLKPVLLFVVVTQFIAHLQVFGQPYIITQGGPGDATRSIVQYLYDVGWRFYRMGYAAAIAFALAVLIFAVTLVNFRLLGKRVEY
jgi:multiple sugar transport system permease protein